MKGRSITLTEYLSKEFLKSGMTINDLHQKTKIPKTSLRVLVKSKVWTYRNGVVYCAVKNCYSRNMLRLLYALKIDLDDLIKNCYNEVYDERSVNVHNSFSFNIDSKTVSSGQKNI